MKIGLVSHYFNEELLLPQWIKWHLPMVDCTYLIDHQSTDESNNIIRELAPDWKIIPSRLDCFDAIANDREVSEVEHLMKDNEAPDWIITLNITETIFTPNLKDRLKLLSTQAPDIQAFGMRSFCMVDPAPNDSLDVLDHQYGYVDYERGVNSARRWRFIHNWLWGNYELGRHGTVLRHTTCPELLIAYWQFAPYPKIRDRKLAVQTRIPQSDKDKGFGFQHLQTEESLTKVYELDVARSYDLNEFPLYKEYADYWRGCQA